eukprot:scaffold62285_cov18-Tisochrysis_lutea.AAC.1
MQVPPPSLAPLTQQQLTTAAAFLQSLPGGFHTPDDDRKQEQALGGRIKEVVCQGAALVDGSAECAVGQSRSAGGAGAQKRVDTGSTATETRVLFSPLELSSGCSDALLGLVRASIKPQPATPPVTSPGAAEQRAAAGRAAAAAAMADVMPGAATAAQGGTLALQAGAVGTQAHHLSVHTAPLPQLLPKGAAGVGNGGPALRSGVGTAPLHQAGAGAALVGRISGEAAGQGRGRGGKGAAGSGRGKKQQQARGGLGTRPGKPQLHLSKSMDLTRAIVMPLLGGLHHRGDSPEYATQEMRTSTLLIQFLVPNPGPSKSHSGTEQVKNCKSIMDSYQYACPTLLAKVSDKTDSKFHQQRGKPEATQLIWIQTDSVFP